MPPALTRRAALAAAAATAAAFAALAPRTAKAAEVDVDIHVFAFVPAAITVAAGTKVTWTNHDDTPHTVTSTAQPPVFKSGPMDSEDSYSRVFDTPGRFAYFCTLHPHMQGTVTVT